MALTTRTRPEGSVGAVTAIGMLLVAGVAFASMPILGKAGYQAGLTLGDMLPVRLLVAGLLLGLFARVVTGDWIYRTAFVWPTFLVGLLFALQGTCFYLSLREIPASVAGLLFYGYPALVALASKFLYGGRLGVRTLLALAASASGILLVVGGGDVEWGTGLFFALLTPFLYSAFLLGIDWFARDVPALSLSTAALLGAVPWLTVMVFAVGAPPAIHVTLEAWWLMALLALSPMVGIPLLTVAMARLGATATAIVSTCEPVFILVMAVVFLDEATTLSQWLGAGLVVAAVSLVATGSAGRELEPQVPSP